MIEALLLLTLALAPALERSQQCKSNCAEENRSSAQRPSDFVIGLGGRVNDLRAHERQPDRAAHHHEADNRRMHAVDSTPLQDDADAMPPALVSRVPPTCVFSSPVTSCSPDGKHDRRQMPKGRIALLSFTPGRPDANEPASADAHSTPSPQVDQVGTMGRYVPEPAGMLGSVKPSAPNGNNCGDNGYGNAEKHGRSGLTEADDHRFAWRRGEGWLFSDMECGHHRSDEQRRYAYQQGNVDHAEILSPDAVGSLGRVGNPFEVSVGMTLLADAGDEASVFAGRDEAASPVLLQRLLRPSWQPLDARQSDLDGQGRDSFAAGMPRAADTDRPHRFQDRKGMVGRFDGVFCGLDERANVKSFHDESIRQEEQGKPDYVLRTGAVFLSALTVAEIEVTRAVIERGGRELNALYKPFVDHPGALGLVNGAVTGGLGLVALELNRRGKKTEARVFVWAMVAVKAVVFTHNVRELRKSGR